MNTIEIGKVIAKKLNNIAPTFPLIAEPNTQFPFIVYRRASLQPYTSKDIFDFREQATIEIIIASNNYEDSIVIAKDVINIMRNFNGIVEGINIDSIKLLDCSEDYLNDVYTQKITLLIDIIE